MGIKLLTRIPWRAVTKIGGVVLLGTASVLGAMETDETTQKVIKKLVSKTVKKN